MKKIVYLGFLASLFIYSCKKDQNTSPSKPIKCLDTAPVWAADYGKWVIIKAEIDQTIAHQYYGWHNDTLWYACESKANAHMGLWRDSVMKKGYAVFHYESYGCPPDADVPCDPAIEAVMLNE